MSIRGFKYPGQTVNALRIRFHTETVVHDTHPLYPHKLPRTKKSHLSRDAGEIIPCVGDSIVPERQRAVAEPQHRRRMTGMGRVYAL